MCNFASECVMQNVHFLISWLLGVQKEEIGSNAFLNFQLLIVFYTTFWQFSTTSDDIVVDNIIIVI